MFLPLTSVSGSSTVKTESDGIPPQEKAKGEWQKREVENEARIAFLEKQNAEMMDSMTQFFAATQPPEAGPGR